MKKNKRLNTNVKPKTPGAHNQVTFPAPGESIVAPERAKFLRLRLREAETKQPELKRLKTVLLRLGGDFLIPPPTPDGIVPLLLQFGVLITGPITLKSMEDSSCHENVAAVWKARRFKIIAVATGFALSEDGIWRRHSWGILRHGILETTEARLKYVGILLEGMGADKFVETFGDATSHR